MILRDMEKEDLKFVNEIRNHNSTRFKLKNPELISLEATLEWFDNKKPAWKIIEVNKEKVGYLRTSADSGESICIGCDIHPEKRRKGFAEKAYVSFMKSLYRDGYLIVWLEVFRDNVPAFKLYKKLGFIEIGSREVNNREYVAMVHRR